MPCQRCDRLCAVGIHGRQKMGKPWDSTSRTQRYEYTGTCIFIFSPFSAFHSFYQVPWWTTIRNRHSGSAQRRRQRPSTTLLWLLAMAQRLWRANWGGNFPTWNSCSSMVIPAVPRLRVKSCFIYLFFSSSSEFPSSCFITFTFVTSFQTTNLRCRKQEFQTKGAYVAYTACNTSFNFTESVCKRIQLLSLKTVLIFVIVVNVIIVQSIDF